jgi:hypothetical protein
VRRLTTLLVMVVVATAGVVAPPTAAQADSDWYRVQNAGSRKCLDHFAWSSRVHQYPCNTQANQLWTWYQVPGRPDAWYIEATQSYGCIETAGAGNSAPLVLRACRSGRTSAMWRWVHVRDGWYAITNVASGRCVDVPNGTTGDVQLVQYDCHHRAHQLWKGEKRVSG